MQDLHMSIYINVSYSCISVYKCMLCMLHGYINEATYAMNFMYMYIDGYYVAYKPITLSCILFMFIEMKFIHCHSEKNSMLL